MKNKIYLLFLVLVLMVSSVLAVSKPTQPMSIAFTTEPIAPGTGEYGCDLNTIKDQTCIGNIYHYNICVIGMDGNFYTQRSADCGATPGFMCIGNGCMKKTDVAWKSTLAIVIILFIIGISMIMYKKIFGRRR